MFRDIKIRTASLFTVVTTLCFISVAVLSAEDDNPFAATSFAFSHYLGTGFYTASGHDVFVLQLPLQHTIVEKTKTQAGVALNLPLTIGFINFDKLNIEDLPDINDVATLTFIPGIEYQYPMSSSWTVTPFVDYGFARDFNQQSNILVLGIGIDSVIPPKNNRS